MPAKEGRTSVHDAAHELIPWELTGWAGSIGPLQGSRSLPAGVYPSDVWLVQPFGFIPVLGNSSDHPLYAERRSEWKGPVKLNEVPSHRTILVCSPEWGVVFLPLLPPLDANHEEGRPSSCSILILGRVVRDDGKGLVGRRVELAVLAIHRIGVRPSAEEVIDVFWQLGRHLGRHGDR
jgi:hypothetical protein